MTEAENLTPFAADSAFAYAVDGTAQVVVCVAGRFNLPAAGDRALLPLRIADEQVPPAMADRHWGDPASSSLRHAGQGVPHRRGTEVYLNGSAWAPHGHATREMRAALRIDALVKQVHVTGHRFWQRSVLGLRPSTPEPFVCMPLRYELAFGGSATDNGRLWQHEGNPVGCGHHPSAGDAVDRPLPNLEAPGSHLHAWRDRIDVCSFGPVPPAWQPRRGRSGTYDARWTEERLPLWPQDIHPEFFRASAEGLSVARALVGGEVVVLHGMSADGDIAFRLPSYRLLAKSYREHGMTRRTMWLGGLLLEPDEHAVTLLWRHRVPLESGDGTHLRTVVRLIEDWEDVPHGSASD